jgi:hypothetical protein
MARPNPIRAIMEQPLPSITYQRRKSFRPSDSDVNYSYNLLNRYLFDNQLSKPKITQGRLIKCWGVCEWFPIQQKFGTYCTIKLSDKWFCQQWFMNTLAHEMVHQYQWDIYRWEHIDYFGKDIYQNSGGHGPSFYMWRDRFETYGLKLKISFGQRRWFKHQDFYKC